MESAFFVITSLALTQLVVQVQVSKPRYNAEPLIRFHTKNSLEADMHVQIYRCLDEAKKKIAKTKNLSNSIVSKFVICYLP